MDSKTSSSILERVRDAKEKAAAEAPMPGILGDTLSAGASGVVPGALIGTGYGAAKGRPLTGAVRGATRGGITMAGAGLGGSLAGRAGEMSGLSDNQRAILGLLGSLGGGFAGWKATDRFIGPKMEEKKGFDPSGDAFAEALQDMASKQLKSDALRDVSRVGLTTLGLGAAGRGIIGLIQSLKANKPKRTRSGPAYLPLPYPAKTANEKQALSPQFLLQAARSAVNRMPQIGYGRAQRFVGKAEANVQRQVGSNPRVPLAGGAATANANAAHNAVQSIHGGLRTGTFNAPGATAPSAAQTRVTDRAMGLGPFPQFGKTASFLSGDSATTKGGIPWYGPAVMLGGMGGLALGWKGMDRILDARRKREMTAEMDRARQQFHDALLSQYDEPRKTNPALVSKTASDSVMEKVGTVLDVLFDKFEAAKEKEAETLGQKQAFDWSNAGGRAAGGYGMYAGLSGLLTGALVYDKMQKRSRRAVLDKALQQRQRRKFMQQPTEIVAVPEPMPGMKAG